VSEISLAALFGGVEAVEGLSRSSGEGGRRLRTRYPPRCPHGDPLQHDGARARVVERAADGGAESMNNYVVISHDAWTTGGYVEGLYDTEEAAVQKSAEVKRTTPNAQVGIYKLLGNIEVQK